MGPEIRADTRRRQFDGGSSRQWDDSLQTRQLQNQERDDGIQEAINQGSKNISVIGGGSTTNLQQNRKDIIADMIKKQVHQKAIMKGKQNVSVPNNVEKKGNSISNCTVTDEDHVLVESDKKRLRNGNSKREVMSSILQQQIKNNS